MAQSRHHELVGIPQAAGERPATLSGDQHTAGMGMLMQECQSVAQSRQGDASQLMDTPQGAGAEGHFLPRGAGAGPSSVCAPAGPAPAEQMRNL